MNLKTVFTIATLTGKRSCFSVRRTKPDTCGIKNDEVPPAYQNHVTHWWDGSQLYGSDQQTHDRVRSFAEGKLKVDDEGFLPVDPKTNIDITGKCAG